MSRIPRLHGDGITDDTEAVQALIEGRPVEIARPEARAILDAIKAEIRAEVAMPIGDGNWSGLRRALAIIERHMKEKGSE